MLAVVNVNYYFIMVDVGKNGWIPDGNVIKAVSYTHLDVYKRQKSNYTYNEFSFSD